MIPHKMRHLPAYENNPKSTSPAENTLEQLLAVNFKLTVSQLCQPQSGLTRTSYPVRNTIVLLTFFPRYPSAFLFAFLCSLHQAKRNKWSLCGKTWPMKKWWSLPV